MLNTLNPTGTVHTTYEAAQRAGAPLGPDMTSFARTHECDADMLVAVFRGISDPRVIATGDARIQPGDYITTHHQLACDYAGTGRVLHAQIPAGDILDSKSEPCGDEYIYYPGAHEKTREH